jgi:hypothetical protein
MVEFNPQLAALLSEMRQRRAPDSSWLFPSPLRVRAMNTQEAFARA